MPKADKEIVPNEAGEWESRDTQSTLDAAPHRALFEDEEGTHTATVAIGDVTFFINEPTSDELAAILSKGQAVMREMQGMKDFKGTPAETRAATDGLAGKQLAVYDALIALAVVDWECSRWKEKRPCTPEAKAKLHVSARAELFDLIMQRCKTGRTQNDFLAK